MKRPSELNYHFNWSSAITLTTSTGFMLHGRLNNFSQRLALYGDNQFTLLWWVSSEVGCLDGMMDNNVALAAHNNTVSCFTSVFAGVVMTQPPFCSKTHQDEEESCLKNNCLVLIKTPIKYIVRKQYLHIRGHCNIQYSLSLRNLRNVFFFFYKMMDSHNG